MTYLFEKIIIPIVVAAFFIMVGINIGEGRNDTGADRFREGQLKVVQGIEEYLQYCNSALVIYQTSEDGFKSLCAVDDPNYDEESNVLWLQRENEK